MSVKKLIALKMSRDAIPKNGTIKDGLDFLLDKNRLNNSCKEAKKWVKDAISVLRQAKEPNPYKNLSDDDIADFILKEVEKKKRGNQ